MRPAIPQLSVAKRAMRSLASALPMLALATVAVAAEPPPERKNELVYRLRQDCGSCHGMTLKGGLGPSLLPHALADRDEENLTNVILHGIPTTPMPPWAFEITRSEAKWLVREMKKGLNDDR